jgi:hypothetical protein
MRKHWVTRNATGGVLPTVRTLTGDFADEIIAGYPVDSFFGDAAAAFIAADGDYNVVCAARGIAELASEGPRKAFLYYFAQGPVGGNPPIVNNSINVTEREGWAGHASEQSFILGDVCAGVGCNNNFTVFDKQLSDDLFHYWGSFVRHGDPSASARKYGLPEWPAYGVDGIAMKLQRGATGGQHIAAAFGYGGGDVNTSTVNCALWDRLTNKYKDTDNGLQQSSVSGRSAGPHGGKTSKIV